MGRGVPLIHTAETYAAGPGPAVARRDNRKARLGTLQLHPVDQALLGHPALATLGTALNLNTRCRASTADSSKWGCPLSTSAVPWPGSRHTSGRSSGRCRTSPPSARPCIGGVGVDRRGARLPRSGRPALPSCAIARCIKNPAVTSVTMGARWSRATPGQPAGPRGGTAP
jgi:hypothetical protein